MSLLLLSSKSDTIIFKILEKINFLSTERLRFTNWKLYEVAKSLEAKGNPMKAENAALIVFSKPCKTTSVLPECRSYEARVGTLKDRGPSLNATLTGGVEHFFGGTYRVTEEPNAKSRIESMDALFSRVTQKVRSFEHLYFYDWHFYDEHLEVLLKFKNELQSVEHFELMLCKINMSEKSFSAMLELLKPTAFHFTFCVFNSDEAISGSVFRNISIVSNCGSYTDPDIGLKLDDSLIDDWCEKIPKRVGFDNLKTDFTIPAIIKLIEVLSLQNEADGSKFKLGVISANDEDHRKLTIFQRTTLGIRWKNSAELNGSKEIRAEWHNGSSVVFKIPTEMHNRELAV